MAATLSCCTSDVKKPLFEKLSSQETGISFQNDLSYNKELNPYTYRNFYNGGGVGIGDFNNDGLQDIFFTANQVSNKLYLNQGDFKFQDITTKAGIASKNVWSTGVSVVDINADGWPDIYVCKSGSRGGANRHNELFINNGDSTFTEKAKEYGLDVVGLSTDAAFFDYDRDGDLDMYLLNNSFEPITRINPEPGLRTIADRNGGDKLYRNETIHESSFNPKPDAPLFTNVTEQAGIYSSKVGFGLDILVGDINGDHWPDLYITNDFFERDYLYINNKDGTFTDKLTTTTKSIGYSSMGGDIGDINHDGKAEIYVSDMLPESLERVKSKTTFYNWDEYTDRITNDYYSQFTRNTLQLNQSFILGNNHHVLFSEISRLAGVDATDWSWTTFFADLNLDGFNDLFVTNGIYKDMTDQDFVKDDQIFRKLRGIVEDNEPVGVLFDEIPSVPLANYAFSGSDSLSFENKAEPWGLADPGFSNGAAYADLDNDGDLDLVINNTNAEASVYQNNTNSLYPDRKALTVKIEGDKANTSGVGTIMTAWSNHKQYYRELQPNRGFQSSVDSRINIGLGNVANVDSIKVYWPNGGISVLKNVKAGSFLTVQESEVAKNNVESSESEDIKTAHSPAILKKIGPQSNINYKHKENEFVDFERNSLLYEMYSREGPANCVADVNNDGLGDVYLGGAKGQAGTIYLQQSNQTFKQERVDVFAEDKESEDIDCTWFDADGDQDLDLYVASGSSEFPSSSSALADRLYINQNGAFSKNENALPASRYEVSSVVKAADFDNDGDIDLFLGSRLKPFAYGIPVSGHLLQNDGMGTFTEAGKMVAPQLSEIGMITDADWVDYDHDGDQDLIVVGEWMPLTVFQNEPNGMGGVQLKNVTSSLGLDNTRGLWKSMMVADLDGDGFKDIIAGNVGLNSRLKASISNPLKLWVNDYDRNGSIEQILTSTNDGADIPLVLKQDLVKQIPSLTNRLPDFKTYAKMNMADLFTEKERANSLILAVNELRNMVFWNEGGLHFKGQGLPQKAQISTVNATAVIKRSEEKTYIIMGGNISAVKPYFGAYLDSYGTMLSFDKTHNINLIENPHSGFYVDGEIRGIHGIDYDKNTLFVVIRNNDSPVWFKENDDE